MPFVLGNDAAWGGWAWCLADAHGPIEVGHVVLESKTWRTWALRDYLHRTLGPVVDRALADSEPGEPPLIVIEEPPQVFRHGTQSAAAGVARLVGAIELWACQPGRLAYPRTVEPEEWRGWWGIQRAGRGRDRDVLKGEAMALVNRHWRGWLDPWPLGSATSSTRSGQMRLTPEAGVRGDVAEAILLAVGTAKRYDAQPIGPRAWRQVVKVGA